MSRKMTLGEYRVESTVNPSQDGAAAAIKRDAANLIDTLYLYYTQTRDGRDSEAAAKLAAERERLFLHAMQLVEDAATNGVKAVTKVARE
jgi:hypothetical protein